ncbi:YkvI family membrane protein [Tuberibacillus calidus]|uniref:YkvI family membrane protein n=1 Tax=Tuberibacillus calidus TaxID=340097 RepID=UPI0004122AC6|nr:membrane protein [Tuberibacillus calidus]
MVLAGLRWMFLILGTMIGAGYASGRELWQFFGQDSSLAILLFTILFIFSTYWIMRISYERKTVHYLPVLSAVLGERLAAVYDFLLFSSLFTTTAVMLSGGGATLEILHVPYWYGVAFIGVLLIVVFIRGVKSMVTINMFIVPVLILVLLLILLLSSHGMKYSWVLPWDGPANWPRALMFTALNVISLVAVVGAIGHEILSKGEIWLASVGSGLILGGISFFYNQSLVQVTKDLLIYEIPLYALIKSFPYFFNIIVSAVLWFAIFTTASTGLLGLVTRVGKYIKKPAWVLTLIFLVLMFPLTLVGFSTLIQVLYPLYALCNLYFLAALLIYPINERGRK